MDSFLPSQLHRIEFDTQPSKTLLVDEHYFLSVLAAQAVQSGQQEQAERASTAAALARTQYEVAQAGATVATAIERSASDHSTALQPIATGIKRLNRSVNKNLQALRQSVEGTTEEVVTLNRQVWDLRHEQHRDLRDLRLTFIQEAGSLRAAINQGVEALCEELDAGFEAIVEAEDETRWAIVSAIRDQETHSMKQLRWQARTVFQAAVAASGTEQSKNFGDARQWYLMVVAEKEGLADLESHFNLGWLFWKTENDLPKAEEHFSACTRYAKAFGETDSEFYLNALWHLAHVHYLQGEYLSAYQTILQAIERFRGVSFLFDKARYAALIGKKNEALSTLESCIHFDPNLRYSALAATEDLAAIMPDVIQLAVRLQEEQRAVQLDLLKRASACLARLAEIRADARTYCPDLDLVSLREALQKLQAAHSAQTLDYPGYRSVLPVLEQQVQNAERQTEELDRKVAAEIARRAQEEVQQEKERARLAREQLVKEQRLAKEQLDTIAEQHAKCQKGEPIAPPEPRKLEDPLKPRPVNVGGAVLNAVGLALLISYLICFILYAAGAVYTALYVENETYQRTWDTYPAFEYQPSVPDRVIITHPNHRRHVYFIPSLSDAEKQVEEGEQRSNYNRQRQEAAERAKTKVKEDSGRQDAVDAFEIAAFLFVILIPFILPFTLDNECKGTMREHLGTIETNARLRADIQRRFEEKTRQWQVCHQEWKEEEARLADQETALQAEYDRLTALLAAPP